MIASRKELFLKLKKDGHLHKRIIKPVGVASHNSLIGLVWSHWHNLASRVAVRQFRDFGLKHTTALTIELHEHEHGHGHGNEHINENEHDHRMETDTGNDTDRT